MPLLKVINPDPPVTSDERNTLTPVDFHFICEDGPAASWHVRRFELQEALSGPYALSIDLLTAAEAVDVQELLGARCTLEVSRGIDGRVVHGVITRVWTLGVFSGRERVRVAIAPALALLSQQTDTRFWQGKTAPQILREVLQGPLRALGCALEMHIEEAAYAPREYCVQYRESDLDFAARLLHEEGLVYFFTHAPDRRGETMVVLGSTARAQELDHPFRTVPYVPRHTGAARCQSIASFDWSRRLETTAVHQRDWDWQDVGAAPYQHAQDSADVRGRVRARYLHDERRLHRDDGGARARLDLESRAAEAEVGLGESDVVELLPGHVVALRGLPCPDLDGDFLLVRVSHRGDAPDAEQFGSDSAQAARYGNTFECVRATTSYRVPHAPPRPRVYGPHTAIVVGPAGEEIHTDEHGRIKVRFHWDRRSPPDDTASCWIRVAQLAAGTGWGAMFIPRVGMEVLVEFIDGDPDRPLVTGCVYNSLNTPPHPLPDQKTRSTLRSESTPGGGGFNELRFEDAKGCEELFLHAQRDLNEVVRHDSSRTVGRNQTCNVGADQRASIGGDQSIVVTGDRTLTVENGDACTTIAAGKSRTTVHGERAVTVEEGDDLLNVRLGRHATTAEKDIWLTSLSGRVELFSLDGMKLISSERELDLTGHTHARLVARTDSLTLQGHTDVTLSSDTTRVEISAPNEVCVTSPEVVDIRGETLQLNALEKIVLSVGASSITIEPASITVSSPRITSAAVGTHELCGAMIKIN